MTPVREFIETLKRHKKSGGTIDDAIITAERILFENERKHIEMAYNTGSKQSDGYWAIGKRPLTASEFYTLKYTKNDSTTTN